MSASVQNPSAGYVTFTLHSHLPYVVHHGTWPHGLDWLHEAAAETYLPLLRVFADLEAQGLALKANVNLSPVLLEQLAHPTFQEEFPKYTQQKIEAARKDAEDFRRRGEPHYEYVAGYFALLGSDASIRAQVRLGVETHKRFFGRAPRGIWLPECAYRPAGEWRYPVSLNGSGPGRPFLRSGIEQILAESGLQYFFVDTHMVEANAVFTPYELLAGDVPIALEHDEGQLTGSFYRPYYADTPTRKKTRVAFFTRDPRTGVQV